MPDFHQFKNYTKNFIENFMKRLLTTHQWSLGGIFFCLGYARRKRLGTTCVHWSNKSKLSVRFFLLFYIISDQFINLLYLVMDANELRKYSTLKR